MTATIALAAGLVSTRLPIRAVVAATVAVLLTTMAPLLMIVWLFLGAAMWGWRRIRSRAAAARRVREDVAALAELTTVGLTGGLDVQAALRLAAETLAGPVGEEAEQVLRRMSIDGSAACFAAGGAGAEMYRIVGRGIRTGSPLLGQMTGLADELHADLAADRLQAARKLPVAMLFPLTLLILPGFMLLTVAPALLEAFGRLQI